MSGPLARRRRLSRRGLAGGGLARRRSGRGLRLRALDRLLQRGHQVDDVGGALRRLLLLGLDLRALQLALLLDQVPERVDIAVVEDRKSTRLNSSHSQISYAVFC